MANSKPKSSRDKSNKEGSAGAEPVTNAHRRKATQHQLDQLRSVLANDLPETERAIVLRRYKTVCQEAVHLGMDVDWHVPLIGEKSLGPENPDVVQSLENYAAQLWQTAHADEAERMEARAKAIRAKCEWVILSGSWPTGRDFRNWLRLLKKSGNTAQ